MRRETIAMCIYGLSDGLLEGLESDERQLKDKDNHVSTQGMDRDAQSATAFRFQQ